MTDDIRCRTYREGKATDQPFVAADVRRALADGACVWLDVVEHPGAQVPALETLLAEALADQVDVAQFEPGRLSHRGKPPKVKVFDDTTFVRAYLIDLRGEAPDRFRSSEVHLLTGPRFLGLGAL